MDPVTIGGSITVGAFLWWFKDKVWAFLTERLYADAIQRGKEERAEERRKEERLFVVVENNTAAMTKMTTTMEYLTDAVLGVRSRPELPAPEKEKERGA